jgi:predicted kinase
MSFKPLPRKGTETFFTMKYQVKEQEFQTTSPQGDENQETVIAFNP